MQRYDALLEEDPEGGWVHYEDVQEILEQGAAINDSLHNRIEQNEKSIADWPTSKEKLKIIDNNKEFAKLKNVMACREPKADMFIEKWIYLKFKRGL